MSDLDVSTLRDLWIAILRRIKAVFVRAFSNGLGWFLVFALSITITALGSRLVYIGAQEDEKNVEALMGAKIEPEPKVTQGAVLSLLLAALDDKTLGRQIYCNGDQFGDCGLGLSIWRHTQNLINASDAYASTTHTMSLHPEGCACTPPQSAMNTAAIPDLAPATMQALRRNARRRSKLSLVSPPPPPARRSGLYACIASPSARAALQDRDAAFLLSPPICRVDSGTDTIEIVPDESADASESPAHAAKPVMKSSPSAAQESRRKTAAPLQAFDMVPSVSIRAFRVLRARLDGDLFALAIARTLRHSLARRRKSRQDGPELVAAYFVSVDSVFRYWARRGPIFPSDFPTYTLWAARHYFQMLLKQPDSTAPVVTRAYMDFGGNGIISTECYPVTDVQPPRTNRGRAALVSAPQGRPALGIAGAVCFDYALTRRSTTTLVHALSRSPLVRATLIDYTPRSANRWAPEGARPDWASTAGVQLALDQAALKIAGTVSSRRNIVILPSRLTNALMYLVPGRLSTDGSVDAILLEIRGVGPFGSRPGTTILTLILGVAAIVAGVFGFGQSQEAARRELVLARLRGLQVGVIQTDGDDKITAANDRAEELLGRLLPAFGLDPAVRPMLWDIFDGGTVLMIDDENPETNFKAGSPEKIRSLRENGKTSSYYVRLKTARVTNNSSNHFSASWLRVTAGPMFWPSSSKQWLDERIDMPRKTGDHYSTFGVLDYVSKKRAKNFDRLTSESARNKETQASQGPTGARR